MNLTPRNAALLSLAVPGAAHVALGRRGLGLAALVSTMALFFAGWSVLGERLWFFEYLTPLSWLKPVFTVIPLHVLPEGMNVAGAAIASLLRAPESFATERLSRMPVPGEHWAMMLTASSGILSVLWAADAHWIARAVPPRADGAPRVPAPALAAALSWLLPGLGHSLAGQRGKGVLMGAAVLIVFALGLIVSHGHGADRQFFGLWWSGAALCAPGLLVVSFVTAPLEFVGEIPPLLDYGVALCTCAGLMNAMVMSDAYTVAERAFLPPAAEAAA